MNLYSTDFPGIQLGPARYSSIALILPVIVLLIQVKCITENRRMNFEFRLDFEYPFNRPQIWLADKNSLYGEGRDLLYYLIKEDQRWGPSMMISAFI